MKKPLIIVTLVEVGVLVGALAGYLVAIANSLRRVSSTLGLITFGVRAVETQTAPIGPVLRDVNGALEGVAAALGQLGTEPAAAPPPAPPAPADSSRIIPG